MTSKPSFAEQVIKRDLDWAQAHRNLDLDLIDDILAEDYQQVRSDGTIIGKQELIDSYRSGDRFWEIAESTDHHVQLVDDLAIVFGRWRSKGVNKGNSFDYQARFLSIYRRDQAGWRMVLDRSVSER